MNTQTFPDGTTGQPPLHGVGRRISGGAGRGYGMFRGWPLWFQALLVALALLVAWETYAAPPWKLGGPPPPQGIDFLARDGTLIAHRGPKTATPVDAAQLPDHVVQAFLAIEDRRFFDHGGIDFRGLARATLANLQAGGVVEGGSTITQQYVKNAFLTQDRTFTRKGKEMILSDWAELWMSKNEILSRYLELCYFGEGQYGLVAAAHHYFDRTPDELTLGQAALLAGMVKAPSRLAPTVDYEASVKRMRVVLGAMAYAGFITEDAAKDEADPKVTPGAEDDDGPSGTWFVDWLMQDMDKDFSGQVQTTLEPDAQARAERVVRNARLGGAEVALIALRPDGSIAAMVGGKEWTPQAFNRATTAQRQPGSTFKLFDYFAGIRSGMTPSTMIGDSPIDVDGWQPRNAYSGYYGPMPLSRAFAISSNTAAIRVADMAGHDAVIKAARDLGIASEIPETPSMALGTAGLTLKELAGAYAAFAGGRYPVRPHGIVTGGRDRSRKLDPQREWAPMLTLLYNAANHGTGRAALIDGQPTFGKTGTSQEGRDALFVGFAGNMITAVWVGRDDNAAIPGNHGGGNPAQIWRQFMSGVKLEPLNLPIKAAAIKRPVPKRTTSADEADMSAIDIDNLPEGEVEFILEGIPELPEGEGIQLPGTVFREGDPDDQPPAAQPNAQPAAPPVGQPQEVPAAREGAQGEQ
ncbi:transglycosylase domain-containing protein [Croceicoccus bisphenolivorans]|uniref:transglycosylase domain-containing protein n=1 Tax=Croceicoccus bisphenolivorans TaxID=1783232 RepID=UPI000A77635C|nr:transglycosylase domain-containing protein [Croceicoccus bisphenolivorans]